MEKADILEMTVKFLRDINRQERTKRGKNFEYFCSFIS